jgi:GT2 family glycosyltransferase
MPSHSDQGSGLLPEASDAELTQTAPERPVDLSIIIVSWNVRDLLATCLRSIMAGQGDLALEVIVVDSASADGTAALVAEQFPWVRLIARPDNVGYARGNNLGLAAARGRALMLLNPDTEIVGEALPRMLALLDGRPEIGVLGPQLLNPDGSVQSSRRRFPTLATGLFESTWLAPLAPRQLLAHYFMLDLPDDEIAAVDWLTGACLLVRRAAAEAAGPLDEAYFMYSEELDWCRRIKAAGWQIVYYPKAQVIHHQGKSSEQAVTERHIHFQRAKLRYFKKHHRPGAARLIRAVLLLNYAWQLAIESVKGILGHRRPLRWQRVRAYWQVLRTGLRPAGD